MRTILSDELKNYAKLDDKNVLPVLTGVTDTLTLDPKKSVYRVSPTVSGTTVTIPTPVSTSIPTESSYYCFEIEVTVDSSATTLAGPSGWTWLDGGGLPTSDFAEKTVYIAVRLDCQARTYLANVWSVR